MNNVRVVLVGTTHPGNIGASARAMKTMGLTRLYLVEPSGFPSPDAVARASGAEDVLSAAEQCATLEEALRGCQVVLGASARLRSLPWPVLEPRDCAQRIVAEPDNEWALVFGRERSGLTNDELERCHYLLSIPTSAQCRSLNLAAAVQVVAYELLLATRGDPDAYSARDDELARAEEMSGFFQHLEQVLVEIEFLDPENPRHTMRRLKRLFNRAQVERTEVNILRGLLSAVRKHTGSAG